MVQVLDAVPSFGEQLAKALGQAGTNISEGFLKRNQNQNDQRLRQELADPNKTDIQRAAILQGLTPDARKSYFETVKNQKTMEEVAKLKREREEEVSEKEGLKENFRQVEEDLIPYSGKFIFSGWQPSIGKLPWTQSFQKREQLDKQGVQLADKAYTKANKGQVSNVKLEFIKTWAPNANLLQSQNRARTDALRAFMNVPADMPKAKMEAFIDQQNRKIKDADSRAERKTGSQARDEKEKPSINSFWK